MQNQFYLTQKLPPYIFAAMYKLKTEAAARGVEIIDFGMGNPDSAPPQFVIDRLCELTRNGGLFGYSVTGGIEVLKKAVCAYYKRRFEVELDYASESLVTIGAKEGIASLATAISDAENYIAVPSPAYPIHTFAFQIAKGNLVQIPAISSQDFLRDFKKLVEEKVAKNEKKPMAVIVSYPCNPTMGIKACKNPNAIKIFFPKPAEEICVKWQLASDGELSHIICMPGVTKEKIDEFLLHLSTKI